MTSGMGKLPLFHETARGGVPAWWFSAPFIAFGYVLVLTPRFLPDIVTVPDPVLRGPTAFTGPRTPTFLWHIGVGLRM